MTKLEKMKKEAQIKKLEASIAEGEIRVVERLEDIERIEQTITDQKKAIEDIKSELEKGE